LVTSFILRHTHQAYIICPIGPLKSFLWTNAKFL